MWFRIFVLIVTVASWGVTAWLFGHHSEQAEVFTRYSFKYFVILLLMTAISLVLTLIHFGSFYRWIFNRRQNLVALSISTILSLCFIELVIRVVDPIGISYYEHAKNYHLDKLADDELYYRHKPNLDREYQGVSVKTNALGMRDSPILEKQTGELRILFLGDSVTFGWGASQENIFAHRVGESLQRQLHRPIRTINTGVGSYNTANQIATLRRYGEQLEPDVVVLVYVGNDIEPLTGKVFDPWSTNSIAGKSPPEALRLLLGTSWAYRLVSHLTRFGASTAEPGLSRSSDGWIESISALRNISAYCNSANIPLFVLMYRMTPNRLENDIARELNLLSEELDFYYDDVLPWFNGKDIRLLINSPVDSHPNEKGHAILTEGIVKGLQRIVLPNGVQQSP